jgi:hypothetical protein
VRRIHRRDDIGDGDDGVARPAAVCDRGRVKQPGPVREWRGAVGGAERVVEVGARAA